MAEELLACDLGCDREFLLYIQSVYQRRLDKRLLTHIIHLIRRRLIPVRVQPLDSRTQVGALSIARLSISQVNTVIYGVHRFDEFRVDPVPQELDIGVALW